MSPKMNLVSRSDLQHLVGKHVASSLGIALLEQPTTSLKWIDVGSGAGFPGVVLKLLFPQCHMTLLDSSRKKTVFLEDLRMQFHLSRLQIIHARVEDLGDIDGTGRGEPGGRGGDVSESVTHPRCGDAYDRITMRAVASLAKSFTWIDGISRPGSRLFTHKGLGWKDELAEAEGAPCAQKWSLLGVHEIPWVASRIMVFERRC